LKFANGVATLPWVSSLEQEFAFWGFLEASKTWAKHPSPHHSHLQHHQNGQ
jgi:hypothetical protein